MEISQKQLADFRRENATKQEILRQQRHDRETRAALVVLEGGRSSKTTVPPATSTSGSEDGRQSQEATADPLPEARSAKHDKLLVFKRIRL